MKSIYLSLIILASSLSAQIYSNQDGSTDGWKITDNHPKGASISNVEINNKNVIRLQGKRTKNEYLLGGRNSQEGWNDLDNPILSWKMKFKERFAIYIPIETEKGKRYLVYKAQERSKGLRKSYIHIGLGKNLKNGSWQSIKRNIQQDLKRFERDNELIAINGFMVRGSGLIDEIETTSEENFNKDNKNIFKIQSFSANNLKETSAEIRLFSFKVSSFQIEYGESKAFGSISSKVENIKETNSIQLLFSTISNLSPDTNYFYKIHAFDTNGQVIISNTKTFKTKRAIVNVDNGQTLSLLKSDVQNITFKTVKLGFRFNIPIVAFQVKYGISTNFESSSRKKTNIQVKSLSQSIASLRPNTKYFYRVLAKDRAGNDFTSVTNTFTTKNGVLDDQNDQSFRIQSVNNFTIGTTSAQFISNFYGAIRAQFEYSKNSNFNDILINEDLFRDQNEKQFLFTKLTDLNSKTVYFYRVHAFDKDENELFSETKSFMTR